MPSGESYSGSSGRPVSAFARLSLATKLLLLVLIPLAVVLGVTVALVINALGRLESDTSIARLRDEVAVISQQFAKVEEDMELRASSLAHDPAILNAVKGDAAGIDSLLLSASIRTSLNHLELVDTDGTTIGRAQPDGSLFPSAEVKELHTLGLAGEKTSRLLPAGEGWVLTVVQPVKIGGNVAGALSAGRLLDDRALSESTSIGRIYCWCFLTHTGGPPRSPGAAPNANWSSRSPIIAAFGRGPAMGRPWLAQPTLLGIATGWHMRP